MIVSATITGSREDEISDAIRSVADHVDKVLVVDTGVADRTIVRAAEASGKKFAVAKHEWSDFSAARNASLDEARRLGADWIVILDSDERFHFGEVDLRAELSRTSSEVLFVESSDGHYPKEKILRASASVRYVGPTHEVPLGGSRETLRGVTFSELGKNQEQLKRKFERDADLLADYVTEHPDDPRWWFYLGQSLEGLGKRARAAEAYGECVARRKVGDEAAWAAYKQAEQLCMLGRHEAAIAAAGRGLGAGVFYGECAWMAAVAASRLGRQSEAIAWARIAEIVGKYKGIGPERTFFRHLPALYELPYDVLRYTLSDEGERRQAESDFHEAKLARVGAKDLHDLDRVSILRTSPGHSRSEARGMLRPLPLAAICPSVKIAPIGFEPPGGRRPMNPSIVLQKGKLWCVVRSVNYLLHGRGQYAIDDADGVVRTENYLGILGEDNKLTEPRLMRDLDPGPRKPSAITGYEDIRLASLKGKLVASATVCDRDPARRLIARLELDPTGSIQQAFVQPSRQWHEKNWMPFAAGGKLAWVYSIDPTIVLVSAERAEEMETRIKPSPLSLEHLRGGAVIPFEDGYLAVCHEVVETNEGRLYLHRFVRMSAEHEVTAASPAWVFCHHGIEFCAGLALRDKKELLLSYGIGDKEAWIMRIDAEEVLAMKWITPP